MTECEVLRQLQRSGYFPACFNRYSLSADGKTLIGNVDITLIGLLKDDAHFANGNFYGYHRDLGADLIDFRSHTGSLGDGSLQGVIEQTTGDCYWDVDQFSPYADLVGVFGHLFGEVMPHSIRSGWRKVFRRKNHENS
jgi:hypothetical protein